MRKSVKFKPDSAFISNAVSEYLANGGKITRTVFDEKSFKNFTSTNEHPGAVDEFLKDQ
jgi:hypothetical protein